jgi:hypothetical protein
MIANNDLIFESPDNGKTIYKREFGKSNNNTIIKELDYPSGPPDSSGNVPNYYFSEVSNHPKNQALWFSIRNKAMTNLELNELLEQAVVLYKLLKDDYK